MQINKIDFGRLRPIEKMAYQRDEIMEEAKGREGSGQRTGGTASEYMGKSVLVLEVIRASGEDGEAEMGGKEGEVMGMTRGNRGLTRGGESRHDPAL